MAKYMVLALTNPVPGREDEYNDWYDNVALPVYRSVPGFNPLGRYKLEDTPAQFPFQMESQWDYLSVYEFETDDFESFSEAVQKAVAASDSYYFSDAIDKTRFFEPVFKAI